MYVTKPIPIFATQDYFWRVDTYIKLFIKPEDLIAQPEIQKIKARTDLDLEGKIKLAKEQERTILDRLVDEVMQKADQGMVKDTEGRAQIGMWTKGDLASVPAIDWDLVFKEE